MGCSIYSDRPVSCKVYKCFWLRGFDVPKPNECGFVIDEDREITSGDKILTAGAAWPDAFKDEKVMYRLKKLVKQWDMPVAINDLGVVCPRGFKWKLALQKRFGTDLVIIWA